MTIKEKFRKSLEEGYKKYLSVHPRSTEKIVKLNEKGTPKEIKKVNFTKNKLNKLKLNL